MAAALVLIQFTGAADSALWTSHKDLRGALNTLCQYYEQQLKLTQPSKYNKADVTYTAEQLLDFIDQVYDVCLLTLESQVYVPHGREWIKKRIFQHLKGLSH